MIETSLTKENITGVGIRTLDYYVEDNPSIIKLSDFITIDTNSNFVDIDYIVNLVHDLDYEGLLYLRNVVEELIEK